MCVIVTSEAGTMPTVTQLAQMSDANPEGAGIAWYNGQQLHRYRNPDNRQTLAHILANWEFYTQVPFLLHFRLAPHGQVCEENTHPFKFRKDGRTGFIAHNGIARSYTQGRFESDSRNAILAWQTGQCDLTNGSQGKFALIDQTGQIEWLTQDHQTIKGQSGLITVSNTNWELSSMTDLDLWDEQAWEDGYQQALENHGLNNCEVNELDWNPTRYR